MDIGKELFEWIFDKVNGTGYFKLLCALNSEDFYALLPLDENRIVDGCELRYKFADECRLSREVIDDNMDMESCTVLEMMVGLAVRVEETIMADVDYGDRTAMWFWTMVKSLGLYNMRDNNFDPILVMETIDTFLTRGYSPDGEGGLFTVKDTNKDMRDVDIWYQMCMFFDNLL